MPGRSGVGNPTAKPVQVRVWEAATGRLVVALEGKPRHHIAGSSGANPKGNAGGQRSVAAGLHNSITRKEVDRVLRHPTVPRAYRSPPYRRPVD